MKKIAVYPGSFDPITFGHLDIIKRAATLADHLYVVVANNVNKKSTFSTEERLTMLNDVIGDIPNVTISTTTDLVVRYAKTLNATILIRGLRNISDYENEYALYQFNRNLEPSIETVILFPSSRNQMVSSTAIKELVYHNADISLYVPNQLIERIVKKLNGKPHK